MIVPLWTTQAWFPKLLKTLVDFPILLPSRRALIRHPLTREPHPNGKMRLTACKLSETLSEARVFQAKLPTSSWLPGDREQKTTIDTTSNKSQSDMSIFSHFKFTFESPNQTLN